MDERKRYLSQEDVGEGYDNHFDTVDSVISDSDSLPDEIEFDSIEELLKMDFEELGYETSKSTDFPYEPKTDRFRSEDEVLTELSDQPPKFEEESVAVMFPELFGEFDGIEVEGNYIHTLGIEETEYADWADLAGRIKTADLKSVTTLIAGIDEIDGELLKLGLRKEVSVSLCLLPGSGFQTVETLEIKREKPEFTNEMYGHIRNKVTTIYDETESASCLVVGRKTLNQITVDEYVDLFGSPPVNYNISTVSLDVPQIARVVVVPGEMLRVIPSKLSGQMKYFEDEIF